MTVRKLVPEHLVTRRRLEAEDRKILDAVEELALDAGLITQQDRKRRAGLKKALATPPASRRSTKS